MNKEQNQKTKLPGFYIAVCCCVLAIGAAGYFTQKKQSVNTSSAVQNAEDTTPVTTVLPTKIPISSIPERSIETPAPIPASNIIEAEDFAEDNPDLEASVTAAAEEILSFVMPAAGEILEQYSDKPVYNSALDDWRTHNGVDIAVNEGGSVCAAADGTISEVTYNAMGCCVTITHSDGYVTKYMQLDSAGESREGAAVKAGDVIGTIGKSTAENVKDSHLHFEMYKDGTCLNPAEALK